MTKQLHEFYVTRKCTKMEYFTVMAESMDEAKYEAEHGYDYYNFDWEEFDYDAHIKNEQIKANLTPEQLQELKELYVDRLVDNMSTKDLVRYVYDDMTDYVNKQSPVEFFDDAYSYFDDYFDELVEEIKGGQSANDLQ